MAADIQTAEASMMMCTLTNTQESNSEIQAMINEVRSKAELAVGRNYSHYEATQFATQLVNGVNYFVKVKTEENNYIHIKLHKVFGGDVTFTCLVDNKAKDDEILYF
ncbi:cystatin-A2-like [Anneissia japonica]|uniref:cystatin-A2-like n=1 Tax=Anneissia japonica TaxID=1529436 RepID=UPI00142567F5|nr:cystatin-A2-like [Anneissia japonica]